jgi:WD40 repeat protein
VGTVRLQHEGGIHCNCFTPDNRILATGGLDGVIRFWDVATGKEVRRFRGHTMHILCLAFTPDGKVMASASWDTTVRLWDTASGQELRSLIGHVDAAICVAFAPDGKTLVTTDRGNSVRQWSTATGKEVRAFVGHENFVNSLAFSPDGRTLFSSAFDQRRRQGGPVVDERERYAVARLRVWEVVTARERRVIDLPADVRNVWLSPDGRLLAQDLKNKAVRVVDVAGGKELGKFPGHEPFTYTVAFAPDGRAVATGSYDRLLRLCDVAGGKVLREVRLDMPVTALGFSPDGKLLASGTGFSVRFWDARTGQEQVTVPMLEPIKAVSLSPDGKTLATAGDEKLLRVEAAIDAPHVPSAPATGDEKLVRLWDADTGKAIRTLAGHTSEVVAVAFSADGKALASAGADGAGQLWDAATGEERKRWSAPRGLTALAFATDGKTLATGGTDKAIRLWDAATGKEIRVLSGHGWSVAGLAFAPDGRTLASAGGDDCTARLWDVATGKELRCLVKRPPTQRIGNRTPRPPSVQSVAFSPDGKTVAVALLGRTIRLVRAATGEELLTLGGDLPLSVTALAFSPDGKTLAAGGWGMNVAGGGDHQVRLWDARTGKLERRLDGHTRQVTALSFSADSNRLASGSTDRTALVWDLSRLPAGRHR